jgi:hypothetical protein
VRALVEFGAAKFFLDPSGESSEEEAVEHRSSQLAISPEVLLEIANEY